MTLKALTRTLALSAMLTLLPCAEAQIPPSGSSRPNPTAAQKAAAQELATGRQALSTKRYSEAERHFRSALGPGENDADTVNLAARMGLADTELALHQYGEAELDYRRVVAAQPQMWVAHKNLVIIEAALGRWDEFNRERALLRAARERGADGISTHESDVIDSFDAAGQHWIVREYFEPLGRSQARYNFESFAPGGRIREYISLELEEAARAAVPAEGAVSIGESKATAPANDRYALDWYATRAHGVIRVYGEEEPTYRNVRADILHWLRASSTKAAAATPAR